MAAIRQTRMRLLTALQRAMTQFLALPTAVVTAFVAFAAALYAADEAWSDGGAPTGFLWLGRLLGDGKAVEALLSTLTSSIMTVTSITFSLLLIALQQGSAAFSPKVTDQFLNRRGNQFFFGYFVGLSVFVLLNLTVSSDMHRPVFGAAAAVLLTMVALGMIVVMIYNTVDQMRPTQIVRAIHRNVLKARSRQLKLLRRTRRAPRPGWHPFATLRADVAGHIRMIDVDRLEAALAHAVDGPAEMQMVGSIGRFLAHGDPVAILRAEKPIPLPPERLAQVSGAMLDILSIRSDRIARDDPSYGIEQLATIGWTSTSTSKSNPAPGLDVLETIRDLLVQWGRDDLEGDHASSVVIEDSCPRHAIDVIEDLILVASESLQAQTLAAAFDTVSLLLPAVPRPWAERLAEVVRRGLSSLGEHVLTLRLEVSLDGLAETLEAQNFGDVADLVVRARDRLSETLGVLNSRSTRAPPRDGSG